MDEIIKQLNHLEQLIKSQGDLYQLTRSKAIPFYRPNGWKMYFRRTELDQWLLRNRITAQAGISKSKKGRK